MIFETTMEGVKDEDGHENETGVKDGDRIKIQ